MNTIIVLVCIIAALIWAWSPYLGMEMENMSKKVTPRKIKRALRELGQTPDQIAETLQFLGIKGWRQDASHCPIANYMRMRFEPHGYVGAGGGTVSVNGESVNCSPAVRDFIRLFDSGLFSTLVGR